MGCFSMFLILFFSGFDDGVPSSLLSNKIISLFFHQVDTVDCDKFSFGDIKFILVPRWVSKMIDRLYCIDLEL